MEPEIERLLQQRAELRKLLWAARVHVRDAFQGRGDRELLRSINEALKR